MSSTYSACVRFGAAFLLLAFLFANCTPAKKTVKPVPDTSDLSERQFRREVVDNG